MGSLIDRIKKVDLTGPGNTRVVLETSVGEAVERVREITVQQPKVLETAEHIDLDHQMPSVSGEQLSVRVSPDVYALTECSPADIARFEREIIQLADLDYGDVAMTVVPADSVQGIFALAQSILSSATPSFWGTTLWPGCPADLRETYAEMARTSAVAAAAPDTVSFATAKEFLELVQLWGKKYAGFVDSAIRAFRALPDGAQIHLLREV
ncbi:hypothetical protein ACWIGI_37620 [Nocardia sp. NPDC055321]